MNGWAIPGAYLFRLYVCSGKRRFRLMNVIPERIIFVSRGITVFLISNFHRVLNVVCFLLGNSPASEFYMPMFRNTRSHLHRRAGMKKISSYLPAYEDGTVCSKMLAYKIQVPGNYPEERIQHVYLFSKNPSLHGCRVRTVCV